MKMPTEESIIKFIKEIMFSPRFQKWWWASVVINISIVIFIKYLDFTYPPSVCCCGCEVGELETCFSGGGLVNSYFVYKRWGALENCSLLCAEIDMKVKSEISYEDYINYTNMFKDLRFLRNDSGHSLFNTSLNGALS